MTNLFDSKRAVEVVPVSSVIQLTGTTPDALGLPDETALEDAIKAWVEETASNIHVRLGRTIDPHGIEAKGMAGVIVRTVANIIAVAQQQRSSPIIQLGDFATNVLNTSDALAQLDTELAPFKAYTPPAPDGTPSTSGVDVFWSSQPYDPKG